MPVDDVIEGMIAKGANSLELEGVATGNGMTSLREDGWRKVLQGVTSVEEVLRVTV